MGKELKAGIMPDIIEWEQAQAEKALDNLEMNLQILVEEEHHDTIAAGNVIRTEPEAETDLLEGQTVTIFVSKGMEIKTSIMPDVVGSKKDVAQKILTDQNLALDIVVEEIYDSTVAAGNVVRTEPKSEEELKTGQKVTLYVSKGQHLEKIKNLVGLSINSAVAVLKEDGFNNYEIVSAASTEQRDTVIAMKVNGKDIKPGDELDVTSLIQLHVSLGPNVNVITKNVTISLKGMTANSSCYVTIKREGSIVFSGEVPKGQETVELEKQTGTGTVTYSVIIGEDGWEQQVAF